MSFLNPLLLFGGLAIASPIIIHLLAKRQVRRMPWAAMRFLRVSVEKNRKRLTLEDIVLLALRCLLLLVAAFALSRPTLRDPAVAVFATGDECALVLLDNSASMSVLDGQSTRFQRAQAAAEQLLDGLPRATPVALWFVNDSVAPVSRELSADDTRIRKAIRSAQPVDRGTQWLPAIQKGIEFLRKQSAARRVLYILSDGQESGWRGMGEMRRLLEAARTEVEARVILTGDAERANLAVVDVRTGSTLVVSGTTARFDVSVRNHGTEPVSSVQVTLAADEQQPGDAGVIDLIAPGETKTLPLYATFPNPGPHTVTARVAPDRCPADDARTFAVRAVADVRVLLVDGEPGTEARESETFYLQNALAPVRPELRDRFFVRTRSITAAALPGIAFRDFDLVVLAGVADFPEAVANALRNYVEQGGGLWVFPGNRFLTSFYNQELHARLRLLPYRFGAPVGDAARRAEFVTWDGGKLDHPVMATWRAVGSGTITAAQFYARAPLLTADGPQGDAAVSTVCWYSDGTLAVVENRVGDGLVVQYSSSAGSRWNDLPVRAAYVPFVHRLLAATVGRSDARLNVRSGETASIRVPVEWATANIMLTVPRSTQPQRARIDAVRTTPLLVHTATDFAGAYRAREAAMGDAPPGEAASAPVVFAVQGDADEGVIGVLSANAWVAFDGVARVIRFAPGVDLRGSLQAERTGREIWFALALIAGGLVLVEPLLANLWTRR